MKPTMITNLKLDTCTYTCIR